MRTAIAGAILILIVGAVGIWHLTSATEAPGVPMSLAPDEAETEVPAVRAENPAAPAPVREAAPVARMPENLLLPPGHPLLTRQGQHVVPEVFARQMAEHEAKKEAYRLQVENETWEESLASLSEGNLPPLFTNTAHLISGLDGDAAQVLANLSKDPRVAKLLEIASGDDVALREELHRNVDQALHEWITRIVEDSSPGNTMVPNGALALPLLYQISGDDAYAVAETLHVVRTERQAAMSTFLDAMPLPDYATGVRIWDHLSDIASECLRLSLRSLSEDAGFRERIPPEAVSVLDDFRRYQSLVVGHQEGVMGAIVGMLREMGVAMTAEEPDPFMAHGVDLIDFFQAGSFTGLADADLRYLDADRGMNPLDVPGHYFELLQAAL